MNDRIDEVDTHAVTFVVRRLTLSTVEQMFVLATNENAESIPITDLADHVTEGSATYSDALVLWLVELYNYGRIDLQQLTSATRTYHAMHPELQVLLYEAVYDVVYPHSVEDLV